jgi:hypothetical protein
VCEAAAGCRFSVTKNICASFVGSVLNISAPVYAQTIMEASLLSTLMTAPIGSSACAGVTSTHYDDQMSRWLKLVRDRTHKIPAL